MPNGAAGLAPDERLRRAEALFFVDDLAEPRLSDEDRHHLIDVLRPRVGEMVAFGDGKGSWRIAEITGLPLHARRGRRPTEQGSPLAFSFDEPVTHGPAFGPELTVAFAIPKGDRLELIVQKLTELGIDRIVPLVTRRTVVHFDDASIRRRTERLQRVAREACAQARRLCLPTVTEPQVLDAFLAAMTDVDHVAVAEPGGGALTAQIHGVVIGPEGGWDQDELPDGIARVGLGSTILRVETAAVVAGALMQAQRTGSV